MKILQGHFLDDGFQSVMDRLNKERIEIINKENRIAEQKRNKLIVKNEKFNELLNKRLLKAIRAIRLLKNLSNKRHYLFNKDELDMILKTCQKSKKEIMKKFKI